ncbi:MAG: AMP-binding protein, partial [Clostridiales Family XIII bacterium]|nr:AMP-binding protein [Clostridiales Family XIII bacterium]
MREKNVVTVGQIYKNNYSADKPAILFKDERVTYAQLDDKVVAFANLLKSKGVSKGDKVILNTINSPEFVYIYFGTVRNAA